MLGCDSTLFVCLCMKTRCPKTNSKVTFCLTLSLQMEFYRLPTLALDISMCDSVVMKKGVEGYLQHSCGLDKFRIRSTIWIMFLST